MIITDNNDCSNIVETGVCVDFHIHSKYSTRKDDNKKIGNNTEENLPVLIENMKKDNLSVDMFSITDHDFFSYSMYEAAKKYEFNGTFKKILPGIEFSVMMKGDNNDEKSIHVICLFNDEDNEKVKKIENIFQNTNELFAYDKQEAYSEEKFLRIIEKIGIDVIMIAHQKNTLTSNTIKEHDVNSLGDNTLNELLFFEYFEAYEFRSKKNRIFNNISKIEKNEKYEQLRFITGSDCHVWSKYPDLDGNKDYIPTFLKCLPTFRGVAMAITDDSRISTFNNFFPDSNYVKKIPYRLNGIDKEIILSKGINAIIGDNSVGKSLLLHAWTNYLKENDQVYKLPSEVKVGYENYLNKNSLFFTNTISSDQILEFDSQGEIRKKFSLKSFDSTKFLSTKFPKSKDYSDKIAIINDELNNFYDAISNKLDYDKEIEKLGNFELLLNDVETITFTYNPIGVNYFSNTKIGKITTRINKMKEIIKKLNELLKNDSDDMIELSNISEIVTKLEKKYTDKNNKILFNKKIGDIIDKVVNDKIEIYKKFQTEEETKKGNYYSNCSILKDTIASLVRKKEKIIKYEFSNTETKIESNYNRYLDYCFYNTIKFPPEYNMKISKKYYDDLIKKVMSKKTKGKIDTSTITNQDLLDSINDSQNFSNGLECLKSKINAIVNSNFENMKKIMKKEIDITNEMSNGVNSQMYFDILAGTPNSNPGIYIIDQPEDDVSQSAIKNNLLKNFKKMSKNRQIILVTHNPQFVVNLDVDNVIFIKKGEEGIEIINGALEYKDKNDSEKDILNIVADNLDGGTNSIKKRWKRYEKNI